MKTFNTKLGRAFNADCFEVMKTMPDGCVDMVLADLPYGTTQNKWDTVIPFPEMWKEFWRICKPNAAIALTAQPPFDKVLGASQIQYLKYEWIWQKTKATGHLNTWKQPLKNHENVLVFYRNQSTYNPQGLNKKETPTIRKGGNNGTNYGKSDKDAIQEYENFPRSILPIPSEGKGIHPTQKPVALFEYLIKTYTNEGNLVFDPTAGSLTTAVAAENLNRRWAVCEMLEDYFDKGTARFV